jgi:flavin-dependent dehydrogenase
VNTGPADLLVVGAGPVGLATAVEAAGAGLSVVVVDPRADPVDKACGEGLMPPARAALARLGVEVAGQPFHGIRYVGSGASATAHFRAGAGLGVRRTVLSAALARRAGELGVRRVPARAGAPVTGPGWVEAAGVRASWLVAADGLHSATRRALGLDVAPRGPIRYGLRRHYSLAPWSDLVEVHWAADAEAYVTPVAPDLVGVAVLCPGGGYEGWLARFPELRERLAGAAPATPVRGAGPLRRVARRRVSGRVLLVGDAAGYVDAITGEGISVGLLSARELVRCLLDGRPEAYEAAWRRVSRRYRALTAGLVWAAHRPALRRQIVPTAQRLPWAFGAVVDQLA